MIWNDTPFTTQVIYIGVVRSAFAELVFSLCFISCLSLTSTVTISFDFGWISSPVILRHEEWTAMYREIISYWGSECQELGWLDGCSHYSHHKSRFTCPFLVLDWFNIRVISEMICLDHLSYHHSLINCGWVLITSILTCTIYTLAPIPSTNPFLSLFWHQQFEDSPLS